jgi:thymidine kinase
MFSGKSARLVRAFRAAEQAGTSVVAFKHADDDRYASGHIVTHDGQSIDAVPIADARRLVETALRATGGLSASADTGRQAASGTRASGTDPELMLIDEAQFFSDDLVDACRSLAERGRDVIVAGLDLDSWGQPFGPMPLLQAVADEVVRTRGTCARCGRPADRTQRLAPVPGRTMVGGAESYEPRCSDCFVPPPARLRC